MASSTKKQHNTYAQIPTKYSIMDALSYLIDECHRINDIDSVIILHKAYNELKGEEKDLSELNEEELNHIIDLFRKILKLKSSERKELLFLLDSTKFSDFM